MRIAQFTLGRPRPDQANGVDKFVFYLSQTLASIGHDVALFSLTHKSAYEVPGVSVKTYAPSRNPFLLPKALRSDLLDWHPDVVHLHSVYTPANTSLSRLLYKRNIPYVVTTHGGLGYHAEKRKWYFKRVYKFLFEKAMLNRALFVHSVGDTQHILNYGTTSPVIYAPLGVESSLEPSNTKQHLLTRFPEAKGKTVFTFLGRLDPYHKGLDLLLQALAMSKLENTILFLIGPDDRRGEETLRTLRADLGITAQVIFTGPAFGQEKRDLLAGTDVFVHTSRWEGFPTAVLEAAAMGKPCLVTSDADPEGLLSKYDASINVNTDAESIADGLRRFAALTPEERRAMGTRAQQMIEDEYSWEKTARLLVDAVEARLPHLSLSATPAY